MAFPSRTRPPLIAERVDEARLGWESSADDEIAEQVDAAEIDALKAPASAAPSELREVNAALGALRGRVEIGEPVPDLPDVDTLIETQAEGFDRGIIDSDMSFVEGTERLRKHNELDYRRERSRARRAARR
jgi:hypothetical protein